MECYELTVENDLAAYKLYKAFCSPGASLRMWHTVDFSPRQISCTEEWRCRRLFRTTVQPSNCVICCGLGHYSSGEFCKSTIGGVGGGRGEHAGISWHAYKYSNFAQRTQLRFHMWDNNNYRTTQLERFHSFSVGSPSPSTHPLDLNSLTFCTFTHKWRPWNWLLTIHGHSEPAPTRAPPTRCPITKLGLLLVAGRRIGFWPVLGGSHFSREPSVLVLYASMWELGWFLIFLEISVGENWPSFKYTRRFSQIQFSIYFLKS